MLKQTVSVLFSLALVSTLLTPPAHAQAALQSQARTGTFGNTSKRTNNYRRANSAFTMNQRLPGVKMAGLGGLAQIHGQTGRNGLPVTSMDSFVLNAGGSADQIYGDEGADGKPPFEEFTQGHRIERGIQGARAAGLTTGHGSRMPAAWGGDEFCKGTEWSQSGSSGGGTTWANQPPTGGNPGTRTDMSGTDPLPGDIPDPNLPPNNPNFATSGF